MGRERGGEGRLGEVDYGGDDGAVWVLVAEAILWGRRCRFVLAKDWPIEEGVSVGSGANDSLYWDRAGLPSVTWGWWVLVGSL